MNMETYESMNAYRKELEAQAERHQQAQSAQKDKKQNALLAAVAMTIQNILS